MLMFLENNGLPALVRYSKSKLARCMFRNTQAWRSRGLDCQAE